MVIAKINNRNKSTCSQESHYVAIRFMFLPLAVFILANIIFSLMAFDIGQLAAELQNRFVSEQQIISPFVEAQARLAWGTTVLLFYTALIVVSIVCLRILRRSLAAKRKLVFTMWGTLIAIAVLGQLAYGAYFRTEMSYIYFFTFDILEACKYYTSSELLAIKVLVSGLNILIVIVSSLALITGCCILSGKREAYRSDMDHLVTQMRTLKIFIAVASILLAAGMLHMVAWLRWPAALIADSPLAQHATSFSEAMSLYWGATFSLLIATFYIPAAWSISRRAETIITEHPEQTGGLALQEWLQKHGMSLSPLQQAPQVIAMLAPLLVGPIGVAFTNLSGTYIGG